jgi:hypothetical protein
MSTTDSIRFQEWWRSYSLKRQDLVISFWVPQVISQVPQVTCNSCHNMFLSQGSAHWCNNYMTLLFCCRYGEMMQFCVWKTGRLDLYNNKTT